MKILKKEILVETAETRITKIDLEAPLIAAKARPGQFVVIMAKEEGERIPLTIVDADVKKGSITLIFQELGLTTKLLGKMNVEDKLYALTGPLGHATEIKNYGKIILIAGGVGIAEIYPVAKAMKEAGNNVTTILGARTKELLILEKELRAVSDALHITTDDGSYGRMGFVTDILREVLNVTRDEGRETGRGSRVTSDESYALVYAVGPIPMMQRVSSIGKEHGVKTVVSLNALMVDGTGMCGCCRVTVEGKVKFSCVDGPEFDGRLVGWDELVKRSKVYCERESQICKLKNL